MFLFVTRKLQYCLKRKKSLKISSFEADLTAWQLFQVSAKGYSIEMYFYDTHFLTINVIFGLGLIINAARVCDRIYVNTGDESKMPYVQLQGVYRKVGMSDGRPMFQHEQRQSCFFQYFRGGNTMEFTWKDEVPGISAVMKNEFASQNWVNSITDQRHPFEKFIKQWAYYDWQTNSNVAIDRDTVQLICADSNFYRCSSGKVYYNTSFNDGRGTVLHNHVTDSFVEESDSGVGDYNNNRKMYRHSRQKHWILYHESSYWKVANDSSGYRRPFLRARDSSMRPEFITAVWERLSGSIWKPWIPLTGMRCRGFLQTFANGTGKTCLDSDPCRNGGKCVDSKLTNETICICRGDYIGDTCTTKQQTCPIYRYDGITVSRVICFGLQTSNPATVFCKDGYQPKFFLSQCVKSTYGNYWSSYDYCRLVPNLRQVTSAPFLRHLGWDISGENKQGFSFDNIPLATPVLLSLVSFLQVCIPLIHMCAANCNGKSSCRVLSLHAFISYICWWIFYIGCVSTKCTEHGQVLVYFSIMCKVMLGCCYVLMLVESCVSSEKKYLSSIIADASAIEFMNKLKNTDPQRVMSIECYHWETRTMTVYYTDSNGNTQTRTETCQERVVTHKESKIFPIAYAEDVTDSQGLNLDQYSVIRLKLNPDVKCGDSETLEKFNEMSDEMVEENRHRDDHIEFSYKDVINGFRERICAYTYPRYRESWINSGCYWTASLFGLSWIFRLMFNCKTKRCNHIIKKLLFFFPARERTEPTPEGSDYLGFMNMGMDSMSTHQLAQQEVCRTTYPFESVAMISMNDPCEPPPDYNTVMAQSINA